MTGDIKGTSNMLTATKAELLLPPLVILGVIALGLLAVALLIKQKSKRRKDLFIDINNCNTNIFTNGRQEKTNKIFPGEEVFNTSLSQSSKKKASAETIPSPLPAPLLFSPNDLRLVQELQGQAGINVRELWYILIPVVSSLGFCPLTLVFGPQIMRALFPSSHFSTTPNINDAIGCYLVPAGMVYAITFGFAFQQVETNFVKAKSGVRDREERLKRLLKLVHNLTSLSPATRVAMVTAVKDVTFTCLSRLVPGAETESDEFCPTGLDQLLYLLCRAKESGEVKAADPWQRAIFQRLERAVSEEEILSTPLVNTRVHLLQWVILESLGYFTFLGMLFVQTGSYRGDLSMCFITVISISFLCYIVADLDSPFYGFFRIDLVGFRKIVKRLEFMFDKCIADMLMEKSGECQVKPK